MKNKVWFITGASKGFGLSLVKQALAKGDLVAATTRDVALLSSHITSENLLILKTDITSEASVQEAVLQTIARFGRIDVVVNNAGYALLGAFEETTDAEYRQTIDVNVFGTVHVIRAAMPHLRQQQSGYIINMASYGGYEGFPSASSYSAAKFAVIGLSESLAREVKPFGIRVTVVAPGYFRTSFLDKGSITFAKNLLQAYGTQQLIAAMEQVEGNQPGDPEKLVASLIALADNPAPPLHLLMGPDAYENVKKKRAAEDEEFETWKHLTLSTNFD